MKFEKRNYEDVTKINSEELVRDRMLITAGNRDDYNTMLASWGGIGVLWGAPVAFIFIRKSRYTTRFVKNNENFSLTFFTKKYNDALSFCGNNSGRDGDKAKKAGLTAVFSENGTYFEEAAIAFNCRKMSETELLPKDFCDGSLVERFYKDSDYHIMYIGKIEEILVNSDEL